MNSKTKTRNWNDVQATITAITVVMTLGLWNLFSRPSKVISTEAAKTQVPPPSEPTEVSEAPMIPGAKIIFTQTAPKQVVITQFQDTKPKNNRGNNNGGGGGGVVTQTTTS